MEDRIVNIGNISTGDRRKIFVIPSCIVHLRLLEDLLQPLGHVAGPAVEDGVPAVHGVVPPEPLRLHQVDFDGHHVSKVLTVSGGHVEDPLLGRDPRHLALGSQHAAGLVQVEAGVSIAGDDPVADHVPGVEVEGGERDDLAPQREAAAHLSLTRLPLEL